MSSLTNKLSERDDRCLYCIPIACGMYIISFVSIINGINNCISAIHYLQLHESKYDIASWVATIISSPGIYANFLFLKWLLDDC